MHCPSITVYLPWVTFSNLRTAIPLMMWFSSISWSSAVFQTVFSGSLFFRFVLKLTVSSFPYAINVQPKPKTSEKAMHPRTQNFILANFIWITSTYPFNLSTVVTYFLTDQHFPFHCPFISIFSLLFPFLENFSPLKRPQWVTARN